MEHHLRVMASEDCVLSFRTSGPNYRTKQMASGDARDPWVTSQQIGTQSLKILQLNDLLLVVLRIIFAVSIVTNVVVGEALHCEWNSSNLNSVFSRSAS